MSLSNASAVAYTLQAILGELTVAQDRELERGRILCRAAARDEGSTTLALESVARLEGMQAARTIITEHLMSL